MVWFTLEETKQQIVQRLGQPAVVADFGSDFRAWQYQINTVDHHEFSHYLTFRRSNETLVSVTRNYEKEQTVDTLFPASESTAYHLSMSGGRQYSILLRCLPGERVLMAMGIAKPDQPTHQLVIMRKADVRFFYPSLSQQLKSDSSVTPQ